MVHIHVHIVPVPWKECDTRKKYGQIELCPEHKSAMECNGMHRESFNPLHNFHDMDIFTITHFSTNMYLYTYNIYVVQIEVKVFMVSF